MHRRSGFSLAELVIAVTIVAVVASVAIPNATSRRILANEACAVVALRDIASAQAKFQAAKFVDVDQDGVGEFGMLRELSGVTGIRNVSDASSYGSVLGTPLLPTAFGRNNHRGEVLRAGYLFHVFLPSQTSEGIPETVAGALSRPLDTDLAETTWGCYAWPRQYGRTGNQTFFVSQAGDIVATDSRTYSRTGAVSYGKAGAAFGPTANIEGYLLPFMTGQLAIGTVGRDGNLWQLVAPNANERRFVARGRWSNRRVWAELRRDEDAASTRERWVIHAVALQPGRSYELMVGYWFANRFDFGTVVADANGRATHRFDSRTDAYPQSLSSLLQLAGSPFYLVDVVDPGASTGSYFGNPKVRGGTAADIDANEAATIAGLRDIAAAQAQFQSLRACDVDNDDVAEFGLLRELTGAIGVRNVADASSEGNVLSPPLLPSDFRDFNRFNGEVSRSGYLLHMVLPTHGGPGVMEVSGTAGLASALDSDLAETTWCCYAWPQRYGKTGTRTFFINQSGDIVATEAFVYSGTGAFIALNAGSAFRSGGAVTNITGQVATGTRGRDSQIWRLVPNRPADHDFVVRGAMTPTTQGPTASATFVVESRQLTNDTRETIEVRASQLDAGATYRVVLTDPSQTKRFENFLGRPYPNGQLILDGRWSYVPDSVSPLTAFSGGTIDVMSGDAVVLRGVLPVFATIGGPHVPGSSVAFHVAKPLDAAPNQLPRRGSLDVRVTNAPEGTREELTVEVTAYDRDADPYGVFAVDALGVATPLGTIAVRGLRGTGTLTLDSARGDVIAGGGLVALSGRTLEVRTPTGFVVLTATLPDVE